MKDLKLLDKLSCHVILCLVLIITAVSTTQAGVISPQLQSALQNIAPDDEIPVIVTLSDRTDISKFKQKDKKLRRGLMIRALRQKAEQTQASYMSFLKGKKAKRIKKLWLINGMSFKAKAKVIKRLATLPGIESIVLDGVVQAPVTTLAAPSSVEWNINAINAPALWDMGYTGQGIVVANMDTGVDITHSDIGNKWRGGTNSWYDPNGEHPNTPYDPLSAGHGTQTMGLMVGGVVGETSIGVAHGAQWIAVKIFDDSGDAPYSSIHQGFQWLLDPDGDPNTNDAPDVVNNSWALDAVDVCINEFQPDIQALKAAGIAVVFAAGNSGDLGPSTSVSPSNNPESYATGSVDELNIIANSSSRGPSKCDGSSIYPEVVAPGVGVKTATVTGGIWPDAHTTVSGTSFAAPHVSGAMALLLNALPDITIAELEFALEQTALDLGVPGPDNNYGNGLIDVEGAYNLILANTSNDMVTVGDVNSNLSEDIAVLWIDLFSGSKYVYVKDGGDGSLIRKIVFNANYTPYDIVAIPDLNNNESQEIGVLGVHVGTGTVHIEIRDALTGGFIKNVWLSQNYTPYQCVVIPDDINDNGEPELGVLGVNVNTGVVRITIRDALSGGYVNNIWFPQEYTPYQCVVIPDGINGKPELGVLGVSVDTGAVRVAIRDALTGSYVKNVWFSQDYAPYQCVVIPDDINGNGEPELGVLGVNVNTGAVRVAIRDALTGSFIKNVWFSQNYTPYQFEVMSDTSGNLVSDIGVLGVDVNTGAVKVTIKDASTGVWLKNIHFDEGYMPQKMVVVRDIDINNMSELAILGKDRVSGNVQVQIEDSLSSAPIATIPIP